MDNELYTKYMTDTESTEENSTETESSGCLSTIIVVLIILGMLAGISSCISHQNSEERESQEAYEENLPKAPDFGFSKEDVTMKAQRLIGEKIKFTAGDFLTTTYTIHSVECTSVEQTGVRRDTVTAELKAYTYYIDGKVTFTRTDKYYYDFDENQWDYYADEWATENIEINN